ncbi:hypothetical protein, partial [Streptomyces yangpuensis]|uniref:hypothetical protein n=1 Tax=Streptomyces yangpuensis TaxID=1648182 RepID=UPI0035DC180C
MAPAPIATVVAEEPVCASSAASPAAGAAAGDEGDALGAVPPPALLGEALGAALGDALCVSLPVGGVLTEAEGRGPPWLGEALAGTLTDGEGAAG